MSGESSEKKYYISCSRCGHVIKPGEKILTFMTSNETQNRDGSVECLDAAAMSSLCSLCASIILTEAVIAKGFTSPKPVEGDVTAVEIEDNDADEEIPEDELEDDEEEKSDGMMAETSIEGFCLVLRCRDGISKAKSRLFTWTQIAQLLIAADPDMFGVLDEPLHRVFPETLERLGFNVPTWRD